MYQFPDLIRRIPERPTTPGCAYKGERYSHGVQVATHEPCLNCTCIGAVVVCYLKVCPAATAPPPGCFLAREVGQCCPSLLCGGDPKQTSSSPDLRPTFQPTLAETDETEEQSPSPTNEENSLMYVTSTQPDDDIPLLNDISTSGGCLVNGTLYGDGSAMLSSSFCEYCFCIRGKTTCLKPKCDLVIEGCTPHYDSSFSCCPSRYDCFSKTPFFDSTIEASTATSTTTTSTTEISETNGGCIEDGHVYEQGDVIANYRPCQSCYCSNKSITCEKMKCSPPLSGCQPIIPEGHCCPVSYKCDYLDDVEKHNVKKTSTDVSTLDTGSKKTDTKTVKQSEIFKNSHDQLDELNPKNSESVQELSSLFHNLVPIHRRLDEDLNNLDAFVNSKFNSSYLPLDYSTTEENIDHTSTIPTRENDKTLNFEELEGEVDTTPTYSTYEEYLRNITDYPELTSESTVKGKKDLGTVVVGQPEVQTVSIESLFDHFFEKNNVSSSEEIQEIQRNNSKQPSSIVEILYSKTTLSPVNFINESSSSENLPTGTDEQVSSSTLKITPEEDTSTISTITDEDLKTKDIGSTNVQTTLYFTEDEGMTDEFTPHIIKEIKNKGTFSFQSTNPSTSTIYATQTFPTLVSSRNSDIIQDNQTTIPAIKSHTRINSKLPISSYSDTESTTKDSKHDSKFPLLEESLVNLYLPAEGRDADSDDDFTNIGAIHLGAPLSVEATELRKDPSNIRNKITESGGVIFMDPKYTDINPNLPSTEIQPEPTQTNPVKEATFNLTDRYPIPIDRSDADYVNYDRKKGPRIQDTYNQTSSGQDFKIIPFVAEDAIQGTFGKGNLTFPIQRHDAPQGVPDMVSDFCFIKGRIYMNGEMISKPDPCELCRCFYGQELCQLQRCPTPPPNCIPEKLPAFCCPRYTCGENPASKEQFPQGQKIIINTETKVPPIRLAPIRETLEKTKQSSQQPEEIKFGIRVRPRPTPISRVRVTVNNHQTTQMIHPFTTRKVELIRTTEQTTKSTRSTTTPLPEVTRPPTTKVPDHNKIPTTEQAEIIKSTEKTASPIFSDPWGLLKVSGCNIYGKFFNINDQVEILSGPCSHCICTATGVECNDIC